MNTCKKTDITPVQHNKIACKGEKLNKSKSSRPKSIKPVKNTQKREPLKNTRRKIYSKTLSDDESCSSSEQDDELSDLEDSPSDTQNDISHSQSDKIKNSNNHEIEQKNATEIPKKKPGRPRKNPIREPKPRNGIVDKPTNENNYIEFLYDKPMVFKKMWGHYKNMAVEKLQMIFRPEELIIFGEDHHQKSKMRACIKTKNINHYYCSGVLDIGIMCSDLEKITSTIDKTCNSIMFLSKKGHTQKTIKIVLATDIEIEKNHVVELIGDYPKLEEEDMFLDMEYPIKFELPGRYFKKMISDIKGFSEQITIRQDSNEHPLIFEYITKDKKIKSEDVVKNGKIIKFQSTIGADDMFRTSFKIDYVKPISSALLADSILICAHETKPLMFMVLVDSNTVDIRILTEIIDERIPRNI